MKGMDMFGQSFQMKLDKGVMSLQTWSGFVVTILLTAIIGGFTLQKFEGLITQRYIDILSVLNENYFDETYVFDTSYGFDIAVGFTAYDGNREIILDPSIGELQFVSYEWGWDENGDSYVSRDIIPSY